jgi:hypothetical protein
MGLLCPMDESYDPIASEDNKNIEVKPGSFEDTLFKKMQPMLEHRHG